MDLVVSEGSCQCLPLRGSEGRDFTSFNVGLVWAAVTLSIAGKYDTKQFGGCCCPSRCLGVLLCI